MERKFKDLEENRKLQKELIEQLQIIVSALEKDIAKLSEELRTKDATIYNLKRKENLCSNGCERYNKSIDEIVLATANHKDAAIALKEACEKQKKKIKEYEKQIDLYEIDLTEHEEQIKQLEEDVNIGFDMNTRKRNEIDKLNAEIQGYKKKEMEFKDVVKHLEK
jgi:chromosome segregation ATPase